MNINDVVIHVNETLSSQNRLDIEDKIRAIDGVIAPRFNDRRPHLMMVAYNPDHLSAGVLLGVVRSQGLHAQHCGA